MNSSDDIMDGAPVGRVGRDVAPVVRRSSSAFGSPGSDSTVKRLDLNDAFIRHPDATFMVRAAGDEMSGTGIGNGDVLLVDRALKAQHGSVVIAVVAGELRCRLLEQPTGGRGRPGVVRLSAADPAVPPIIISDDSPLEVWGVVTTVIKSLV
jgi:DNA polymerase V